MNQLTVEKLITYLLGENIFLSQIIMNGLYLDLGKAQNTFKGGTPIIHSWPFLLVSSAFSNLFYQVYTRQQKFGKSLHLPEVYFSLYNPVLVIWEENKDGGNEEKGGGLLLTVKHWCLISLKQLSMGEN